MSCLHCKYVSEDEGGIYVKRETEEILKSLSLDEKIALEVDIKDMGYYNSSCVTG